MNTDSCSSVGIMIPILCPTRWTVRAYSLCSVYNSHATMLLQKDLLVPSEGSKNYLRNTICQQRLNNLMVLIVSN